MENGDDLAKQAINSIQITWAEGAACVLVQRGANVNYQEPFQLKTILHEAAAFGFSDLVTAILRRDNVDTAIRDGLGRTASDHAMQNAHFEIAEKIARYVPS